MNNTVKKEGLPHLVEKIANFMRGDCKGVFG
jgi:hypothetical protein